MKHLKHLFTALLLMCATVVTAHDFEVGGIYYKITDATNKTVEVTYRGSYINNYDNEYIGSVVIPESVISNGNTYSVTSIGYSAFYNCSGLTSVEIPNSVTSIGERAFSYCSGLTSVEIPNSVTFIGESAFEDCSGLTSAVIGNSVTSIGYSAFRDCSSLTSVVIPNSVTSIGNYAFRDCTSLTSVEFNAENCTTMGYYDDLVFSGCTALSTVTIGENVKTIPAYAFRGCSGLTSIVIGDGVISIGNYAFRDCSGLTSVVIPNSVTSIAYEAFYGCTGLTSIEIPNSVTSIESSAFNGCTSLKDIRFADGEGALSLGCHTSYISSTGKGMFYDCPLETLYLGRDLSYNTSSSYGYSPFNNKTTLTSVTISDSVTSIGEYAFYGCTCLTSVVIPNSVTSIGYKAFYGCTSIENLCIGNSIESIGNFAFAGCDKIKEIKIEQEKPIWGDISFFEKGVYDNAVLYVPAGTKSFYEKREPWNLFFYIEEMDFTGIDEVLDEVKGEPTVDTSQNGEVKGVYDFQGRIVDTPSKGLYIVNGKKVFIK